jgi:hypothetical protein
MRFSFENQAAMAGDGSKKSQVSTAPPRKMNSKICRRQST